MVGTASPGSLAQRTGVALAQALRNGAHRDPLLANGRIRRLSDLLIDGLDDEQLPDSLDRTRLRSPHSAGALTINTFLPWQAAAGALPLGGHVGFDAIQFEVRCPTGLRGTPPHLDLLALRDDAAVAVTVRCSEYLSRRKSVVAPSYDRFLAQTPGVELWRDQLQWLRAGPVQRRYVDLGALVKHALALGRTFPDRPAILLYLYWEPVDADRFEDFRRHRAELEDVAEAVRGARIGFSAQSFESLWRDWAARTSPPWLAEHVARLRARYGVAIGPFPGL